MNPIMWDESTQMLFVTNESGIFAVELCTVSMGPMTRVDSIPETARRWEPLSNIPAHPQRQRHNRRRQTC